MILTVIAESLEDMSVATLQRGSPKPEYNRRMAEEEGECREEATYASTKRSRVRRALRPLEPSAPIQQSIDPDNSDDTFDLVIKNE